MLLVRYDLISIDKKILLFGLLSIISTRVMAEGSRELLGLQGERAYLEFSEDTTADIQHQAIIKVFVKAGEQIHLGSSVPESANGPADIVYRSPSGNQNGSCDVQENGSGLIDTLAKEQAGPAVIADNGYNACQVTANETGVYEIEFHAPKTTGNPDKQLAVDEAFPIDDSQNKAVAAWDVTVIDPNPNPPSEQKGRAYANYLPLHMAKAGAALYAQPFVLSDTGYLYRVDLNGNDPWQFMFFANSKGFQDNDGNALFKSVPANATVHNPSAPDVPASNDITHKIFFNLPDDDLPSAAQTPSGQTWLLSEQPALPHISNFTFTGSEGTSNQLGSSPLKGAFSFDTDSPGSYILTIDVNQNNIYGDDNDKLLSGPANKGQNTVQWNGLDGNNDPLAPHAFSYGAKLSLIVDDVHFPFLDVENNPKGLIVQQLKQNDPTQIENSIVYYNNQDINGQGAPEPISATAGVDSSQGAQAFTDNFGNNKGIDTWTSIAKPLKLAGGIVIKEADLSVTKTHSPNQPVVGGPINYTITINNAGPNDVSGVKVIDNIPEEITLTHWLCSPNCSPENGNGDVNTTVDLKKDDAVTLKLRGHIKENLTPDTTITNSATIIRPKDVTNPKPNGTGDLKRETAEDSFTLMQPEVPIVNNILVPEAITDIPTALPPLEGVDPTGGVITTYTIGTLPLGTLYLGDPATGGKAINAGDTLTPAEINTLYIQAPPNFVGNTEFTYTATNNQGKISTPAVVIILVTQIKTPINPTDNTIAPTFVPVYKTLSVSLAGPGEGSILSEPAGIHCYAPDGLCTQKYKILTEVKLVPKAHPGSRFKAWINNETCRGGPEIELFLDQDIHCTAFFEVQPYTLTVAVKGQGQVNSQPQQVNCVDQCTYELQPETTVQLIAQAPAGWQFQGWQGQCRHDGQVTMTADKYCQAVFIPVVDTPVVIETVNTPKPAADETVSLTIEKTGHGQVTTTDMVCGDSCRADYPRNTQLKLNAIPTIGYAFLGFEGDCDHHGEVGLTTDKTCRVHFGLIPTPHYNLTVTQNGGGQVNSQPAGIVCGTSCQARYPAETQIQLIPTAAPGFHFVGFEGDCMPQGQLTLQADSHCSAHFEPITAQLQISIIGAGQVNTQTHSCVDECTYHYPFNTQVNLTATAADGWQLAHQTCSPLSLFLEDDTRCQFFFIQENATNPSLHIGISGPGQVISDANGGINCFHDCVEYYPEDTQVTLTAVAQSGALFSHWAGDCQGQQNSMSLEITDTQICTAHFFTPIQLQFIQPQWQVNEGIGDFTLAIHLLGHPIEPIEAQLIPQQNDDYQVQCEPLRWVVGELRTKTCSVEIINDDLIEEHEQFSLTLVESQGTVERLGSTQITIIDDDCQGNAFNEQAQLDTRICFSGRIQTAAGLRPNHVRLTHIEAQQIELSATLKVAPQHVGQGAYLYKLMLPGLQTQPEVWHSIEPANAFKHYQHLPEQLDVFLYQQDLSQRAGEYTVLFGYQLTDGALFYNGQDPIHFFVEKKPLAVDLLDFNAISQDKIISLTWETAAEQINAGFFVWRATKDKKHHYQHIVRVNQTIIPAQGNTVSGAKYAYIDRTVKAGNKYYYVLEAVDLNGDSHFYYPFLTSVQFK